MSIDYSDRETKLNSAGYNIAPWTFGRRQAELISQDPGVRALLVKLAPRFFAGSTYNVAELRSSRYAIADVDDREILYGEHTFDGGRTVVTAHQLHPVVPAIVERGVYDGQDAVVDDPDADICFLLESLDPHAYADIALFSNDGVAALERLMLADEEDLATASLQ